MENKELVEKINEGNKLIADFMKLKSGIYPSVDGKGYWETEIGDIKKSEACYLPYHSDWNWLMPVVKKLNSMPLPFGFNGLVEADIEKTYNSVIKVIKFYKK